jgi:SAM-dependent methyltransferase
MDAMTTHKTLTGRQQREAEFYQHYAARQRVDRVDLAPVLGHERRPWNPYWHVYELARRRFLHGGQRLLDFGCGAGAASIRFAHLGYQVDGFDLSEDNLAIARDLAEVHGLAAQCTFTPMLAEQLDYPEDTFDVVVGIDILHHVEIARAVREARRVLRPGGVAIFKEHVEAPVLDRARNSALGLRLAPRRASLDLHITEDERKLSAADVRDLAGAFDRIETHRFTLISRMDRFLPPDRSDLRGQLQRLDRRLMQVCPPLARLAGTAVFVCHKHG